MSLYIFGCYFPYCFGVVSVTAFKIETSNIFQKTYYNGLTHDNKFHSTKTKQHCNQYLLLSELKGLQAQTSEVVSDTQMKHRLKQRNRIKKKKKRQN